MGNEPGGTMETNRRLARKTLFASFAVAATAVSLSWIASGFLPADPHVGVTRAQAMIDRAERIQDVHASAPLVKLAQVRTIVR
jgi:hypothetical protein